MFWLNDERKKSGAGREWGEKLNHDQELNLGP